MDPYELAREYQKKSGYVRDKLRHEVNWAQKPATYQRFNNVTYQQLPEPQTTGGIGLWTCLANRRSNRRFSQDPLSIEELSQLLWASQGISHRLTNAELRTAPSAGALYPIETYVQINRIETLQPGLYHYHVLDHALGSLHSDDNSYLLAEACLGQKMIAQSSVTFLWSLVTQRTFWKYGNRGLRYMYLDSGHVAQNLYLAATALDLNCCAIGAFFDDEVDNLLGLDGQEEVSVYMACVGHKG